MPSREWAWDHVASKKGWRSFRASDHDYPRIPGALRRAYAFSGHFGPRFPCLFVTPNLP